MGADEPMYVQTGLAPYNARGSWFRDQPKNDHVNGRVWRITARDGPTHKPNYKS